ncbi:MAG: DUF2892 domain-containing protein [Acidobacteriota bacterium]
MQPNIGPTDRILRIILGLVLLSLIVWGPQTWWGLLGIIPLATAFVSFCPLYRIFNFSTLEKPVGGTQKIAK